MEASTWNRRVNAHTLTFNVTAVNDPPVGLDGRVTTSEDTPYVFRVADFGFFDPVDLPNPNNFVAVKIEFLPISGVLRNQGNPVSAGQMIARADIDAGNFTYTPNANQWGSPLTSFAFRVKDDGGTLNGGVDTAISPNTMTVTVLPVNDAPIGTSGTVTALAGNAYTVHASDFGFSDPNDSPPNAFKNVIITAASVAAGSLTLAGTPISAASLPLVVSKANLDAGLLQYQRPLTSPQTLDSFQFRVQDDGGTANLGLDVDFFAKTLTFNILPVRNHDPAESITRFKTHSKTLRTRLRWPISHLFDQNMRA